MRGQRLILKVSHRRADSTTLIAFAAIAVAEQVRQILDLTRHYTNEDQTLIWLAGRTWWRGSMPQPDFWGQTYGITLEGIPAELIRRLGGGWGTSLLITLVALHLLSWWILGLAALKRGSRFAAFVAFGAPILLTTRWSAAVGVYPTALGRSLAIAAVATAIWPEQRRYFPTIITALAAFAVLFDTSTVVLVAPLLIWCVARWRLRAVRTSAALGLVAPLLWFGYLIAFRRRHSDYELHYRPSIRPQLGILRSNIAHPARIFDVFGLDLLAYWWVPVGLFMAIAVVIARRRNSVLMLAASGFAAPTIFALTTDHSQSGADPSFYLLSARILFPLPFALWFLGMLVLDGERTAKSARRANFSPAYVALIALVLVSATARASTTPSDNDHLLAEARDRPDFPIRSTAALLDLCEQIDALAASSGTRVVVFPDDRPATYACAAIHPHLTTVQPGFDRRTWVLHDLAARTVDSIIVWDMSCPAASAAFACDSVGANSVLRFSPQSALDIVDKLGVTIRPFGEDCVPHSPETCQEWSTRFPASAEGWARFLEATRN